MVTIHRAILIKGYLAKSAEAVELARQSRNDGREAAHRGYVDEALHWKAMADAVARKAEVGQEVTHA